MFFSFLLGDSNTGGCISRVAVVTSLQGIAIAGRGAVGAGTEAVCALVGACSVPDMDIAVVNRSGLDEIAVEPLLKLKELHDLTNSSHREFLAALKEGALEDVIRHTSGSDVRKAAKFFGHGPISARLGE